MGQGSRGGWGVLLLGEGIDGGVWGNVNGNRRGGGEGNMINGHDKCGPRWIYGC